jgi:hypothetical protein
MAERIAATEETQHAAEARIPQLEAQRAAATNRLHEATRELAGLEAALNALEAQQAKLDTDSKLKEWVEAHGLERAERLWQTIHCGSGWDDAVEAALGVRLNAARLATAPPCRSSSTTRPPGNFAVFLERAAPAAAGPTSHLKPLSSIVSSSRDGVTAYLRDALATVFILPEGEDGMELARLLPPGGLLVTRAGHLFSRQGVVFHGPHSELHGVLQRQREIEDLQGRIPQRARERDEAQSRVQSLEIELREGQEAARGAATSSAPAPARAWTSKSNSCSFRKAPGRRRRAARRSARSLRRSRKTRPASASRCRRRSTRCSRARRRSRKWCSACRRWSSRRGRRRRRSTRRAKPSPQPNAPCPRRSSTSAAATRRWRAQGTLAVSLGERLQRSHEPR